MGIMWAFAFYEQVSTVVWNNWEYVKQEVRNWLGPEPLTYLLIEDGQVLPSTVALPDDYKSTTYVFHPATKQITLYTEPNPEGRFRPLPFLGMSIGERNLSDWVGEIRSNPALPNISAKQILQLWSASNHTFLPKTGTIQIVQSDGTEESVTY